MRTVYLGTSDFAVSVLRRLAASPHSPQLVVTRPDRPKGRGRRVLPPPVADAARELGIEVLQPDSVNSDEARAAIAAARPEAVCICAFGALIKEPLLSEHSMLNVNRFHRILKWMLALAKAATFTLTSTLVLPTR